MYPIAFGSKRKVEIVCLKKYDISNITKSEKDEMRLRNKKWGFGETYTDEIADIELCTTDWQKNNNKLYLENYIYKISTENILMYIKKYRSKRKFLSSWWFDEELKRHLTGEEKWNFLINSLQKYGWDPQQPACIRIRKPKKAIVVNGHHRIAIAHYLKIPYVPISFLYR